MWATRTIKIYMADGRAEAKIIISEFGVGIGIAVVLFNPDTDADTKIRKG